jgi:hypothetical protein
MSLTSYRAAPPRAKKTILKCERPPRRALAEHKELGTCRRGLRLSDFVFSLETVPIGRPGGDLLSHALRHSTISAESFHGRVRNGIGWFTSR